MRKRKERRTGKAMRIRREERSRRTKKQRKSSIEGGEGEMCKRKERTGEQ